MTYLQIFVIYRVMQQNIYHYFGIFIKKVFIIKFEKVLLLKLHSTTSKIILNLSLILC